ncbi:hypothetical protein FQR65_LT20405 [Abscondita terminalis]|nr:hypothetical protein FQR65_LT20405 [Abscondita terminalis]
MAQSRARRAGPGGRRGGGPRAGRSAPPGAASSRDRQAPRRNRGRGSAGEIRIAGFISACRCQQCLAEDDGDDLDLIFARPDTVGPDAAAGVSHALGFEIFGLREAVLRYGENGHQRGALFTESGGAGIAQASQLHGKEMSYNNYIDADAALRAAFDHERPAVAIIKHANPCGVAVAPEGAADPIAAAHALAHACDPVSAFGGVIAANREVTRGMAEAVAEIFTEVIVAPAFAPEALAILTQKKNVRLLVLPADFTPNPVELRQVSGGFLLQDADRAFAPASEWQLVTGTAADAETLADLEFAWRACRAVKSNAILLAAGGASVGVGMGQVNRVDSCRLAVERAGDRARGSVAASDAFFPFADGLQVLLDAGVRAIVQPGGSVRDPEVIAAAKAAGAAIGRPKKEGTKMEIVRGILIVLHIVGFGLVFGGAVGQLSAVKRGAARVLPIMLWGALLLLVTGLALVGMIYALDENGPNNFKIAVKLVVLLALIGHIFAVRKKENLSAASLYAIHFASSTSVESWIDKMSTSWWSSASLRQEGPDGKKYVPGMAAHEERLLYGLCSNRSS